MDQTGQAHRAVINVEIHFNTPTICNGAGTAFHFFLLNFMASHSFSGMSSLSSKAIIMDSILTPGEGLFCTGCGIFCEYRVVKSNEKGNKGQVMVSVSLATVLFLLYLTFPNQCNQVKDSVSCNFFWWKKGLTWSPTASPALTTTSPNLPTPSPTLPTSPTATFDATRTVPNPNVLCPVAQKLHPVISRSVTTVCPVPGCNQSCIHPDCK